MITIARNGGCCVTVTGHGAPLVCAAVSALMLTLGANVAALRQEDLLLGRKIRLQSGNSIVACRPKDTVAPAAELIFDSLWQGMTVLRQLYPKQIRLKVDGCVS